MHSSESDLLTHVERQVLLLSRDYRLKKEEIEELTAERDQLLSQNNLYAQELTKLKEQLSLASFALPKTPDAIANLNELRREIQEITLEVDECITLLRRGTK